MERRVTDYDLTMNVEQDSQGSTEYIAALYTPAIGHHQGRGKEPHLAVIALAYKIMEWDQINARSTKPLTAGAFGDAIAKALNQPTGKWAWLEPAAPVLSPELEAIKDRIKNIGRIVWYTPSPDDVLDCSKRVLPAIITREWTGNHMDLQVFGSTSVYARHSVEYNMLPKPGVWCWPLKGNDHV
jgi:hypothetical protein